MITMEELNEVSTMIFGLNRLELKAKYLGEKLDEFIINESHEQALNVNERIDITNKLNEVMEMNSLSELTQEQLIETIGLVNRLNEVKANEQLMSERWNEQYMPMNIIYANVLNEKYDLEAKLKEVGL